MPIIASAKKQNRQNKVRKARNDRFKSLYRESRKEFEAAIKAGDLKAAQKAFFNQKDTDGKTTQSGLQSNIDKLVKKNLIHKNNGARKKSNFVKIMKTLDTKGTTFSGTTAKKAPAKKTAAKTTAKKAAPKKKAPAKKAAPKKTEAK